MARGVDVGLAEAADEALGADHAAPMALLVGPRGDVDGEMRGLGILGQRARDLEAVDHAHHAVEPAAARLGVGVRAHQQARPALGAAADDVADAVDHRLQPRLLHAAGEPVPALDVLRRQVRAMHAGLVAAEIGDAAQVGQKSFAIDAGHGARPQCRCAATQAAVESSRSSSWRRPTSWMPSGRPLAPVPAGRVTQGVPAERPDRVEARIAGELDAGRRLARRAGTEQHVDLVEQQIDMGLERHRLALGGDVALQRDVEAALQAPSISSPLTLSGLRSRSSA